jgi:hypothetical protein
VGCVLEVPSKPKQQGWVVGVSRFGHVDGNHPAPGSQRVLVDRDDGTTVRFWAWRRYVPKGRYPTELVYYLTSTRSSGSLPAKTTMTLRGIP